MASNDWDAKTITEGVEDQIQDILSEFSTTEDKLDNAQKEIEDLEAKIVGLEEGIAELEEELTELKAKSDG